MKRVIGRVYSFEALIFPVAFLLLHLASVRADEPDLLPAEAAEILKSFEDEAEKIRAKAELEVTVKREAAIRKLQEVQDKYTRDAKLDEAVAIRDTIRGLKSAGLRPLPDPGNLINFRGQNGKVMTFDVVGSANGSVYGTDIYTDDSTLSAAAVHANALRPGERGIVKVTIMPGQDSYLGSQRNGLVSSQYFQYPGSYKVQSLFRGHRPAVNPIVPRGGARNVEPLGLPLREPRQNVRLLEVPADAPGPKAPDLTESDN